MRRQEFLSGLLAASVASAARAAGSGKIYRVAVAAHSAPVADISEIGLWNPFFLGELRRLGYVEGDNLVVLRFSAEGDTASMASFAT